MKVRYEISSGLGSISAGFLIPGGWLIATNNQPTTILAIVEWAAENGLTVPVSAEWTSHFIGPPTYYDPSRERISIPGRSNRELLVYSTARVSAHLAGEDGLRRLLVKFTWEFQTGTPQVGSGHWQVEEI